MGHYITSFVSFLAGGMTFINLNFLLEPVTNYDAQWWKVIACILIVIGFNIGDRRIEKRY